MRCAEIENSTKIMDSCDIFNLNLKFFDEIKPKSQFPSYTVLATLNDNQTGELLALATGTQANLRVYPNDIEDCHAESLVKRAYKRYIIQRFLDNNIINGEQLQNIVAEECSRQLVFSISQFPCGLLKRYEGDPLIDQKTGNMIDRKPGRGQMKDNQMVYVQRQCCINKLRRWTHEGLQGKTFKKSLSVHGRIARVVIGDCEQESNFDYNCHLVALQSCLQSEDNLIRCDHVTMRRDEFVYSPEKQPQPVSVVWWKQTNKSHNLELVVDGRKKGLTKKQCLSDNESFKLRISDQVISRDLHRLKSMLATPDT